MNSKQSTLQYRLIAFLTLLCVTLLCGLWCLREPVDSKKQPTSATAPRLLADALDAIPLLPLKPNMDSAVSLATFNVAEEIKDQGVVTLKYANSAGTTVTSGNLLLLNGDDFQFGFTVTISGFDSTADEGGTVRLYAKPKVPADQENSDLVNPFPLTPHIPVRTTAGNIRTIEDFVIKEPGFDEIVDQGEFVVYALWDAPGALTWKTAETEIKIDTRGPILQSIELEGGKVDEATFNLVGSKLVLEFDRGDFHLDAAKTKANYKIETINEDGSFSPASVGIGTIDVKDQRIVLPLDSLARGIYRIRVVGTANSQSAMNAARPDSSATAPLLDESGNYAGGSGTNGSNQEKIFGHSPPSKEAKFVEFPEFQPTAPQPDHARRINPGDKVETAVVRLYYFRDAHRVAQLINRTAESLNAAAVTLAERRAEDARKSADDLTDERRANEREAVRRAEQLRQAEKEVQSFENMQSQLGTQDARLKKEQEDIVGEIAGLQGEIDALNTKIETERQRLASKADTPPAVNDAEDEKAPAAPAAEAAEAAAARQRVYTARRSFVTRLPRVVPAAWLDDSADAAEPKNSAVDSPLIREWLRQRNAKTAAKTKLETRLSELQTGHAVVTRQLNELPSVIAEKRAPLGSLRDQAANTNEKAIAAQAKEDRAREEQFRREVSAAKEDPDTFAAAKLSSVDPVAQVSVSVIGEGLLQLRGPRKGIDKIRTLVHQIDAPLGQVKVEVVTVQLNGERGERMEAPLGKVEAHLGLGRFLTSQSLMLLRQAIQEEAARVASENDFGGHHQVDRDRKYLYSFFGRDFIDELYEMESEFLNTENKLLGLHSMDTISQHQAFFILALAKNDLRHLILNNFMEKVRTNLVQAEFDYRRSAEIYPYKTRNWLPKKHATCRDSLILKGIALENQRRYHFRNLLTFFGGLNCQSGETMNSTQREFVRLAQIFKSRLVAELELKQRIIERTMIESDREFNLAEEEEARNAIRPRILQSVKELQRKRFEATEQVNDSIGRVYEFVLRARSQSDSVNTQTRNAIAKLRQINESLPKRADLIQITLQTNEFQFSRTLIDAMTSALDNTKNALDQTKLITPETREGKTLYDKIDESIDTSRGDITALKKHIEDRNPSAAASMVSAAIGAILELPNKMDRYIQISDSLLQRIVLRLEQLRSSADVRRLNWKQVVESHEELRGLLSSWPLLMQRDPTAIGSLNEAVMHISKLELAEAQLQSAKFFLQTTRKSLERKKLLDFLIEEQEEKVIDLLEGTRAKIAAMDNYLKRLSIALEDDFKMQFYDPAFVRIRSAARQWDVSFSQVERTSILTNNRAFAKVTPQATMEFDLPKRKIAIVEAFDAAKALTEDYGALLQDPTFLAAFKLMGGDKQGTKVQSLTPGLGTDRDEQRMGVTSDPKSPSGSALQDLVPDPAIYKIETGTGYEIRPVIQPDGNSIVYDFNYMYSTQIREPVAADEKHLGRIRRHFINTQVQTSSFELRELSRYQVALKVSRTSQGVPMLQDIPGLGMLFRPAPSDESSIQQNVILAQSVVYPTLFELMGLRWAPSVVDLDHISVRDSEHVVRGRRQVVSDAVFDLSTRTVDEILGLEIDAPEHLRRDLYHRQRHPSPYHPGGYTYPKLGPDQDPTGNGFERRDRRPVDMREPRYDRRFRHPIRDENVPNTMDSAEIIDLNEDSASVNASPIYARSRPSSRRETPNAQVELLPPRQERVAPNSLRSPASVLSPKSN